MSPHIHSHPRGVTLIELTVVISMILSLISALFVSANYYKEAADKAACITLISQHQKAVRAHQNFKGLANGDSISASDFYGEGKAFEIEPSCPHGGGKYSILGEIPSAGVAFATCAEYDSSTGSVDKSQAHNPESLKNW